MKGLLGCCEYKDDGWVKLVLENITKTGRFDNY
jgi:hypothetical protein